MANSPKRGSGLEHKTEPVPKSSAAERSNLEWLEKNVNFQAESSSLRKKEKERMTDFYRLHINPAFPGLNHDHFAADGTNVF